MSPNQWGPPTWTLLHTMAEKIKDERYSIIGRQLFNYILQICYNLPCPECSSHAKMFLTKVNANNLSTKNDLKTLLFVFHNTVNRRKQKPLSQIEELEIYKTKNIINVFNEFIQNYHTRGNMQQLSESFHRNRLTIQFKTWFMHNIQSFNL